MKSVYSEGLGLRYGRVMQAISGVRANHSFPQHFWRSMRRARSRVLDAGSFRQATSTCCATTGASVGSCSPSSAPPRVCKSSCAGGALLPQLSAVPLHEPYAPASHERHRLSQPNHSGLSVSVNSLDEYVRDLTRAITTPHPPYEELGVKVERRVPAVERQHPADRERVLQLHPARSGSRVPASGRPRRCSGPASNTSRFARSDVSAFDPVGVNQNKLRFLEAFLALCLLKDSPPIGDDEQEALDRNHLTSRAAGASRG